MRPTRLGPGNPEASGWVLFSTESKWINGFKKQEEFILRVPLAGEMFEFPFKLPAKPGEVMLRRRKHGIDQAVRDVPVGMFCFDLLYADGEDLTRLPYPERRARRAQAITPSPRLRLTDATEVSDADVLEARFAQALL